MAGALTTALFAPSLDVGFVSDDFPHLLLARRIEWMEVFQAIPGVLHYSPVSLAWRKLLDSVSGGEAQAWHLAAMGLLFVAAVLAGRVARGMGSSRIEAAGVTAVFPTLACACEPTVWCTVNVYLLALCFYLGALVAYMRFQRAPCWSRYLVVLALAIAAVLSIESTILLLPSLVVLEYARGGKREAMAAWPRYVVPALLIVVFLLVRPRSGEIQALSVELVLKRIVVSCAYLASFNQASLLRIYFAWPEVRWLVSLLLMLMGSLALFKGPRRVRAQLAFAVGHFAPHALLGAPHPRYFLLGAAGMAALWMAAIVTGSRAVLLRGTPGAIGRGWKRFALTLGLVSLVVAAGFAHTRERIEAWRASSATVTLARTTLATRLSGATAALVLVDFPEMAAPYHDVDWPPYMFLSAFNDMALLRVGGAQVLPPRLLLISRAADPERPRVGEPVSEAALTGYLRRPGYLVLRFDDATGSVVDLPVPPPGGTR